MKLDLGHFVRMQMLDETRTSTVLCLRSRRTGRLFAGKRSKKGTALALENYENEVRMLRILADTNLVVTLVGAFETESEYWIVLGLCGGGNLEAWLERFPHTARGVARQLLETVQQLHALLIVHLDLKPGNVLFDDNGKARLCDLATATQLTKLDQRITGSFGTEGFKAPEVGSGAPFDPFKADVFSLGRTLLMVVKMDLSWSRGLVPVGDMVSRDPCERPDLASVQKELFPPGSSENPVEVVPVLEDSLRELMLQLNEEPWEQQQPNRASTPGTKGKGLATTPKLRGTAAPRQSPKATPPLRGQGGGLFAPL